MWALDNNTVFAADRTWVRDKHGRHHWVVVVKGTFEFTLDGLTRLADEQLPPLHAPEYFGEPGKSSLRYEADLTARKPGPDVLINAHAHAPGGRAAQEVNIGLRIGSLTKQLLVRGECEFDLAGIGVSSRRPFVTRPIRYEYAYGGTDAVDENPRNHRHDPRNPVGRGFAARREHLSGAMAPSIYYPDKDPARVGPAGFGAIASHWSPRLELGGTYDERWVATKKPLLPDDHDEAQLLCAPVDQRVQALHGGELVELVNMTPTGALRLELPKRAIVCTTHIAGRREEQRCRLVTVVIEPEESRLVMVWQASIPVGNLDVDYLDRSVIKEKRYLR